MNQKGFATIFGLCLILAIALVVKGIEEAEMNHAYEATDIQAEVELQNAADSGIYEAAKVALADPAGTLPINSDSSNRKDYQHKFDNLSIKSKSLGTITVETWGERTTFHPYKVFYYNSKDEAVEDKSRIIKNANGKTVYQEAYVFFSVASADSNRMNGKIYRRAYAYVLADGDATIHFMGLPTSTYTFK
ncbi:MAG: hypothetical protein IKD73_00330 [Selenomonadaceae bacterium]|nr:hypothetical protein [Selenomonadaceae bacterium]